MSKNKKSAIAVVKSINRYLRKNLVFVGGKSFGIDYNTWVISHPKKAAVVNSCASEILGRKVTRGIPAGVF